MHFLLPIDIPKLQPPIAHHQKLLLMGSCFTEHITRFLEQAKYSCMQNSHGILFNPISVCKALDDLSEAKVYAPDDLFLLDEYWHSWYHHSDFSSRFPDQTLSLINTEIQHQHHFLTQADYIFITLGSAFAYWHQEKEIYVSNNHRAPATWFRKDLLPTQTMIESLENSLTKLKKINPNLKVVLTISPVRHARDGVIQNNRSKARLIEAVHSLKDVYYFPAYELVIDVLRDYRFYDLDMVHPNYQATRYVWEQFVAHCIDPNCLPIMKEMEQLQKALHHKPKDTESQAHKRFLKDYAEKSSSLQAQFPYLDLSKELAYFNS